MAAENTVMLSRFTLAFKEDCLKGLHWFGPGLSPSKAINALGRLSAQAEEFLVVDYSRLDGSISEWLQREIVIATYMRWCAEPDKAELSKLLKDVFKQSAVTAHGIPYKPGYGTRSGSAITTDGNTMICAFVVYCAFRKMGLEPELAYAKVGLVYGDDGAFPAYDGLGEQLRIVAAELGLNIKLDVLEKGQPIQYLGRYFVDPLTIKDSFQDPIRTISKLHLTANMQVTAEQALANKALGYLATDAKTPIIGTWARKVLELTGITKAKGLTAEEQHKMSNAWPQMDSNIILESMAAVLEMSSAELRYLDRLVGEVTALDQFPVVLATVRENKIPAAVGGDIVGTGHHEKQDVKRKQKSVNQSETTGEQLPGVAPVRRRGNKKHRKSDGSQTPGLRGEVRQGRLETRQRGQRRNRGSSGSPQRNAVHQVRRPKVTFGTVAEDVGVSPNVALPSHP